MSRLTRFFGSVWRGFTRIGNSTVSAFLKRIARIMVIAAVAISAVFVAIVHYPATTVPDVEPISETRYLGQGWELEAASTLRETYNYTPQGSSVPAGHTVDALRYDWLVHLERAWGRDRFANPQHMRSLGFIVDDAPSPANPDLLPVGLTKHWDESIGEHLLDITCSACHTGQLIVEKNGIRTAVRIDGGSATHAIMDLSLKQFAPSLIAAMASTYFNPFKFNRFARKVLQEDYKKGKPRLKKNFWRTMIALATQKQNNPLRRIFPVEEGYGRVDAIGRIANTVFGDHLVTKNFKKADAPVSYPPLWNAWKFNWVQYSGSVKQPMARNMGEVLGVGARINLVDPYGKPLPKEQRFTSSVKVPELHLLETTLQQLNQPQWDEELFGAIDRSKSAAGKELFEQHCQSCHGPHISSEMVKRAEAPLKGPDDPEWVVKLLHVNEIGTDSTAADNFVDNKYDMSATGITNQDAAGLLRPSLVKALKNQVDAVFVSPFLDRFLSSGNPVSADLKRDTNWMNSEPWKLSVFEGLFSNWYETGPGTLEKAMLDKIGNPEKMELVRIELVRQALEDIEQDLDKTDVTDVSVGQGLNYLGFLMREKYYADNNVSQARQACLNGFGTMDVPEVERVYKARPLGGMWATPPFLHNGSVLSIYQLLGPVEERQSVFYLGQNVFDSEKLGLIPDRKEDGGILFDASIKGNYNAGHEFNDKYIPYKKEYSEAYKEPDNPQKGIVGPALSHDERMAIVEYLKIHQDPPTPRGRVIQTCENL